MPSDLIYSSGFPRLLSYLDMTTGKN